MFISNVSFGEDQIENFRKSNLINAHQHNFK